MPDNHLVLAPGAKLASSSPEFVTDIRNGNSTNFVYEGTHAECITQRAISVSLGANHTSLRPRGDGFWQLTVSFPFDTEQEQADEPAGDVHEIEVESSQLSIYSSLKLRTVFGGGKINLQSDKVLGVVFQAAKGFEIGDDIAKVEGAVTTAVTKLAGAAIAAKAIRLFRGVAYRGSDSFREYNPVYRRTITAATPLQTRVSFKGVGKIWTTAEMRDFEQLPREWWFKLPADYQWLKSMPTVHTVAGQKTQITYNYLGGLKWWAASYDKYRSAVLLDEDDFTVTP